MSHANEQNQQCYDLIATHYAQTRMWTTKDLQPFLEYVRDGDRILDLACGNARLYQLFVEHSRQERVTYQGVDFSGGLLAMAREHFPEIDVRYGEMTAIPFDDNAFDVAFCLAGFHHASSDDERVRILKEVRRVLKPEGTFIMTNWNLYSNWAKGKVGEGKWHIGNDPTEYVVPWRNPKGEIVGERLYYAYTQDEIMKWCATVGFVVQEQYFASKKPSKEVDDGMNLVTICKKST